MSIMPYKYNVLYYIYMASIIIKNSTISFNKEDGNKRTQITGYPTVGTIISWAGNNISHLNNTKYLWLIFCFID